MNHISLKTFLGELQALATMPVFHNHDITPWTYDLFETLGDTPEEIHKGIQVINKCLQFLEIKNPVGSPLFFLEKRAFHVFAHMLKIRHADSIEVFRLTDPCARSCNDTFANVFFQLSNELLFDDLDNNPTRAKFTNVLITIITLAYNDGLPMLKVPDFSKWELIPSRDIKYDIVYGLTDVPYILKMVEGDRVHYLNASNLRGIDLDVNDTFHIGHFLSIYNPRSNYSGQDRMVDMSFYGIDGVTAYAIMDKSTKEVI